MMTDPVGDYIWLKICWQQLDVTDWWIPLVNCLPVAELPIPVGVAGENNFNDQSMTRI